MKKDTIIQHYKILSPIGKGGMGEVYLAQDTKLDRKVAIKFLNEEFSKDADKLGRFIQEAKAASALNHPNILTVYEIGEADGRNYIATELIEGKTLREHLSHKESLQLNQILKIGVQVAEALSAAHHAGIIHRDIKPENIMIRKDGYAKVLDFGLAKLSEPPASVGGTAANEDATRMQVNTTPGMVMGTVSYMSPEQARGNPTDARTDIWSLGIVLYEMCAGKVPFTGETVNHTIVSILEKEPLLLENVPDELQRIVRKSLTKDVDMRYQSAHDLLIDLKNLRRDLDIKGELERSVVPNRATVTETSSENATQFYTADAEATRSGQAAATQNVTTSSSSLEYAITQAKSRKMVAAIIGLLLISAISAVAYFGFFAKAGAKQIESIAVMPFVNESGNPDVEYLSDGMTETLIGSLSNVPNLSVKPRSTVFRYKGKDTDAKTIGKELNVQAILNGRVVQRGDQLTLSLELIDVEKDIVLWSQQYNRKQAELVTLQTDIARDVSSKLKTKLSGADVAKVEKNSTTNPEAYQLYLKGLFQMNRRTGESLKQAAELFKQAIEKDPNYAPAYVGLGSTLQSFPIWGLALPKDCFPQAKAAALRALELDDSLAEAQVILGVYLERYEWDWIGSEKEFRRAIELDPNNPMVHSALGGAIANQKRFDEAIALTRRAVELDPLSKRGRLGEVLIYSRRYDEAIAEMKAALLLDPNYADTYWILGKAYLCKGSYQEAIAIIQRYLELDDDPVTRAMLAFAQAKAGNREEAVKQLDRLKQESSRRYVSGYAFALVYLALDKKDEALTWLEKDVEDRSIWAAYYAVDPLLDEVRGEPRFKAMLKRMNLPE